MLPRPHSSSDALRKLSSRLHSDAGRLATLIPPRSTPVAAVPCVLSLDSLALPDPPSITTSLAKIGVEQQYAERMSTAMTNALLQFKAECQAIFQRRLPLLRVQYQQIQDPKFLATIPLTYLTIYNSAIRNHTSYLLNEVAPRIIRAQQLRHKIKNRGGRVSSGTPFNYSAIPILKRFFSENAFPSGLEKEELAARCNMDRKQIKDWFQNRRNRYKKDGKELKRRPPGHPVYDEVEEAVIDALLPYTDDESTQPGGNSHSETVVTDTFNLECPPHAFPSPYPPTCSYDPFPIAPDQRMFHVSWSPVCRTPVKNTKANPTVDELVRAMAQLTLTDIHSAEVDQARPSLLKAIGSSQQPSSPVIGFTTLCCRAPHPALLRTSKRTARHQRQCSPPTTRTTGLHTPLVRYRRKPKSSGRRLEPPMQTLDVRSDDCPTTSVHLSTSNVSRRGLQRRAPKNPPLHMRERDSPIATISPFTRVAVSRMSSVASSEASVSSSDDDSLPSTPTQFAVSLPTPLLAPPAWDSLLESLAGTSWPIADDVSSSASKDFVDVPHALLPLS